jgi:hypothetical protein
MNYERDPEAFPADAYTVAEWGEGIAWYALGWETQPDADTEWSGYEERTGNVACRMVGDDRYFSIDPADLTPLDPLAFCRTCGQVGCGCNVYE